MGISKNSNSTVSPRLGVWQIVAREVSRPFRRRASRRPDIRPNSKPARTELPRSVPALECPYSILQRKYQSHTMIPADVFIGNLKTASDMQSVPGCIVECGTWWGGMIAAIAEVLGPDRHYYLFDSYEGLPPARPIDGAAAIAWQADEHGAGYHQNCTASQDEARAAMAMSGAKHVTITKGWFDDTVPDFRPQTPIALLRLDADWFDSTLTCLESLYPHMSPDGLIVIDDYYFWDGCTRAVHHFLAKYGYAARISQSHGICTMRPNFARASA